jgi:dTDP-4-dehydrorhamnose reductase
MRILVTGVRGQVGGALVPRLQRCGSVIASAADTIDLARPEGLSAVLDRLAPELIVNPAAYTAVDKAEAEPDLAMAVNATTPGIMARWAAARAVPLIHFSTDYVFSGAGERPWREDDAPAPLSVYGASKLAGDNAIRAAGGPSLILRTSWVYAAQGTNFLRTIARLAAERKALRIVADQVGAPTPAAVLADAVTWIVGEGFSEGMDRVRARCAQAKGLVHLTASGATSWHGFACAIVEGLRARGVALAVDEIVPIRTEEYPTPAKRPLNSRLDLNRLREVFGSSPISWQAALAAELDQLAPELSKGPGDEAPAPHFGTSKRSALP